jgi:hypothetical protein
MYTSTVWDSIKIFILWGRHVDRVGCKVNVRTYLVSKTNNGVGSRTAVKSLLEKSLYGCEMS